MTQSAIIPFAMLVATLCAAALFMFLQRVKRLEYLRIWTYGWYALVARDLLLVLQMWLPGHMWPLDLGRCLMGAAILTFLCSARIYARSAPYKKLLIAAEAAFVVWMIAFRLGAVSASPSAVISSLFFLTGWVFWREGEKRKSPADTLMASMFALWGLVMVIRLFFTSLTPGSVNNFVAIAHVPQLLAAVLMVMVVYEDEKRRVQNDILALSNLNLATSSTQVSGEVQSMLLQALERVQSVVRFPAGAICLHHRDPRGPKAIVTIGLNEEFCRIAKEQQLDQYLISEVTRRGGYALIRVTARERSFVEPENDEAFQSFQELAGSHGIRSAVAVSLEDREDPCGLLLLASPEPRRLTQPELRLVRALARQIGMAIENSYLIQETARRSKELNVLNEIGRALGSTLDLDELFDKIYNALQMMFDARNFYIALYDGGQNQIRFELEVADGVRLPKRSRLVSNHLTEYIIRTRQSVLIRENLVSEAQELGVQPVQQKGSFCGVPLVAYEHAIGVMAVRGSQEGLYDEGHLETMRVLASEAAVAIENARLFREEQVKSRHLALLNNISRNAITTLNPDEMLAKIAEQLESGLAFDHIGIALLEYATKEVTIQAEAGKRRGALGMRLSLDESLVGRVARTGQMSVARDLAGRNLGVLQDSVSAIALPILYADHLYGVLYVETAQPRDFSEEEVLLLHTLADLIAGALHNAFTFQKAKEQAITDGLTGAKTHRFLMEALSAEWKRSTRGSRPFSLALVDLDRFKFVNDFHGHLEGDLVLRRIGSVLEQNCRRSDVVARYGGDEFVILMPETTIEQALQLAQKLRSAISTDPLLHEKNVTASFGIASFPLHGSTPQELIQIADASMYLSKHKGGNAVSTADHFDPNETKKWKRDVLEAYLGVTLKRLFSTGPEAFEEIHGRLVQFARSLAAEPDLANQDTNTSLIDSPSGWKSLPPAVIETVTSLALAIDAKDHFTQGHSQKVSAYAALLAESLGLNEEEIGEIRLGAILHDIGKVGIPEEILNKSGPLNPDEWEIMKSHTRYGMKMLEMLKPIARVRDMVGHHHEMFDGSGYPDGLAGQQIPMGARIIAIADAYDTMTSERVYKKPRTSDAAFSELERCAGAQFDPELVHVFINAVRQLLHPTLGVEGVPIRQNAR